ncbi:MAG: InlB B-repeat-containing protein [Clostridia bacterium]|nr:InlB B-repeat-containing protein [Clostridia bacterium]
MERTKEQGITLIALVITIIVLLILAGVALATLTGNSSIIDNANYAVTEYNKSANSDQNVLNQVENLFAKYMGEETKYTITYNANGGTGTMEEEEASRTATSTFTPPEGKQFKEWNTAADGSGTSYPAGATVPSDVTLYAIWYAPLSAHVQVGDYITYDPTLGVTDSSLLTYTSPRGSLKIKNGDEYVVNEEASSSWDYIYNGVHNLLNEYGEFVIPTGYTVESNDHGNGVFPQTFTATSSNNLWRVLDVNATTGVIKIVPETTIKTTDSYTFYIVGLTGYKNMNTELNNISEVFGYGQGANGARSITVEDVNRLTGYEPEDSELVEVTEINKTWYNNDYYYNGDSYPGANENITSMIYKPDYSSYWLASRFINVSSSDAKFNIPSINLGLYTQVARSRKFILYSNLHRCRK